jgi:hypothetical protein
MAVTVKTGGVFTKNPGDRPGLYVRFIEKAIAAIGVGARAKVAIVKTKFTGEAVQDKVYKITNMEDAYKLFGEENVKDINYILLGGASEVVVATQSPATEGQPLSAAEYTEALNLLETYEFHIFVAEPGLAVENGAVATWLQTSKGEGKSFVVVYADASVEGDVAAVKTKAQTLADEYAVFVGNGVVDGNGSQVDAELYACYIAGLIAGAALDGSITFEEVPFAETITRFRTTEVKELLAAGIVVTVMDGDTPKIEQGLTLGDRANMEFNKIRTVRAKQAMIDDINRAVNDAYVGNITNSPDGQIAVVNAVKAYLETLANGNVVAQDFTVEVDKTQASVGAELYINVAVRFLDSIEYVYMTVTV